MSRDFLVISIVKGMKNKCIIIPEKSLQSDILNFSLELFERKLNK